jgi:hypothetical protein
MTAIPDDILRDARECLREYGFSRLTQTDRVALAIAAERTKALNDRATLVAERERALNAHTTTRAVARDLLGVIAAEVAVHAKTATFRETVRRAHMVLATPLMQPVHPEVKDD